jgi:hypothetical protein
VRHAPVLRGLSAPDGHLERVDDQLVAHVVGDRPAHDAAAPGVEDDGQVDLALAGGVLGHVHDPQPVLARKDELEECVVPDKMNPLAWLRKHLEEDGSDLLREMIREFAGQLMAAEAQGLRNAGYGKVSASGVNFRNGYRSREIDTRVAPSRWPFPKLRRGSYFPDWLLEPRRRAEQALTQVVCQCYVEGVSTRRVDDIVKTLGIEGISRSQVSRLAKTLDATVEAFRSRPLDAGPNTYVWLDASCRTARRVGRRPSLHVRRVN